MVRITDLAAAIAAKHHISQREAERFLTRMVEVMNNALRYEKQLKIKGLGTFKVASVSPRESVNIHTGERIVIEGREKISFTPDAVMRDWVNRPFAQFETVVVNDGVDFDDIDRKYQNEMSAVEENAESESIEADNIAAAVAPVLGVIEPETVDAVQEEPQPIEIVDEEPQPIDIVEEEPEPEVAVEEEPQPIDVVEEEPEVEELAEPEAVESMEEVAEPEDIESIEEEAEPEEIAEAETVAQVVPLVSQVELADEPSESTNQIANIQKQEETSAMNDETEVKVDEYGYPIVDREENKRLKEQLKKKTRLVRALVAALVALLLIGAGGFWHMNNIIKEKNNRIDHLVAQIKEEHHGALAQSTAGVRPADVQPGRPPRQSADNDRKNAEQAAADHDRKVKEHEIALKAEELKHQEAIKKAQEARRVEEARQAEQIKKEMERRKAEEAKQAAAKAEAAKQAAAKAEAAKQAAAKAEAAKQAAAKADAAKQAAAKAEAAKKAAAAKKTATTSNASYNDDPRVRTGAYVITGVSETVTVRAGQTLASISKAYLGPGMECYVEAINGGIKTVTAGQKIKIPALKVKQAAKKKQ
jgi:nucleoid DNA-binding protein